MEIIGEVGRRQDGRGSGGTERWSGQETGQETAEK